MLCSSSRDRLLFRTRITTYCCSLSQAWLAPEGWRGEPMTPACDVYSFGVVCWELMSATVPWGEIDARALALVVGRERRRLECDASWILSPVIKKCFWAPKRRPPFNALASAIATLIAELSAKEDVHEAHSVLLEDMTCPISYAVMQDPVITADGHTYERASIAKWLKQNDRSPLTNIRLKHKRLTPNIAMKKMITALESQQSA